jgi:photosystem II 13kDa protein
MAEIRFCRAVVEEVIPDVRLTRSRTGDTGTATFYFENPKALDQESMEDVTGMYLIDEEGELVSREVTAKFINGQPAALEGLLVMKSVQEWERFMRFMERYAEEHGLGFNKSE